MRKIIAIDHVTLDGVIQGPGGPQEDPRGGFTLGGWSMAYQDEAGGKILGEIMSRPFDLLLGRRTYDTFAGHWPHAGDNYIAKVFNKAAKYAVTNSPGKLDWAVTHRINGDAVDGIRKLKTSEGPELHLWGSHQLLQTLIAADLVDEFRLFTYPVVLGMGKRLFENGVPPRGLTLVESRSTPKGLLCNTYRPAGPLPKA